MSRGRTGPPETEWLRLDDDLRLARWRTDRLLALGYELRDAARLAVSSIDIHELERLIGMGCPPETTHLSLVARTPVLKSFSRRPFESDPLSLCRI